MNQYNCLPQDGVFWGEHILQSTVARLADYGIGHAITFTVEPLAKLNQTHVQPNLKQGVGTFTDLPAHAPDSAIQQGLDACERAGAESIIALGGGSVLDAAKAVSHLHHERTGRFLPIAALPTTLSGSEFSHYFGITETDGAQKFKRSYAVRETTPKVVVIDPVLVLDTPRALLLSSAVKGMDHAVEGMRKVTKEHPHAIMAASGVARFLRVLEKWPKATQTREAIEKGLVTTDDLLQLQLAAWQCYFSPASVIYGLSHRIGHILGGTYGLPHSATSCITLAPVIRACADFYGEKLEVFAASVGEDDVATQLAEKISGVVKTLGLPDRVSAFDLDKARLPEVATLLKKNYPNEVADLGAGASAKLDALLESLW
ncbi:iron-containing alcohol dehydrogenase [Variovorax sp. J22P240]|uniref:iron-containing alcohol dehydrogenase n=1 Tax=unclassified Variovorax TaxID=663243 RepID=UPI0025776401|nr:MULTISPECIES: iron-containing alcohol dehydrogenase [unclassified Variovorax]MDM0001035.1 iron-containing alcohol dehydrogenase [Variovorax sp. J22P240]MDM0049875.1 iron-containing alcohol dehydrogenase [Variovorax sp. J22R115]